MGAEICFLLLILMGEWRRKGISIMDVSSIVIILILIYLLVNEKGPNDRSKRR